MLGHSLYGTNKTKTKTFLFSLTAHLHALIRQKCLTKMRCVFIGIVLNNKTSHSLLGLWSVTHLLKSYKELVLNSLYPVSLYMYLYSLMLHKSSKKFCISLQNLYHCIWMFVQATVHDTPKVVHKLQPSSAIIVVKQVEKCCREGWRASRYSGVMLQVEDGISAQDSALLGWWIVALVVVKYWNQHCNVRFLEIPRPRKFPGLYCQSHVAFAMKWRVTWIERARDHADLAEEHGWYRPAWSFVNPDKYCILFVMQFGQLTDIQDPYLVRYGGLESPFPIRHLDGNEWFSRGSHSVYY